MVYSRNVDAALGFYQGLLGMELLETYQAPGRTVYARLKAPQGDSTIALHLLEPGRELHPGAVRLYFEVPDLVRFCQRLQTRGAKFTKPPRLMPWGWRHAYLNDPDGHEVSLYTAGAKRLRKARAR
jgi:catechol 2,3-dioxygenase-like lactoylglutathione lyase family enzyme